MHTKPLHYISVHQTITSPICTLDQHTIYVYLTLTHYIHVHQTNTSYACTPNQGVVLCANQSNIKLYDARMTAVPPISRAVSLPPHDSSDENTENTI